MNAPFQKIGRLLMPRHFVTPNCILWEKVNVFIKTERRLFSKCRANAKCAVSKARKFRAPPYIAIRNCGILGQGVRKSAWAHPFSMGNSGWDQNRWNICRVSHLDLLPFRRVGLRLSFCSCHGNQIVALDEALAGWLCRRALHYILAGETKSRFKLALARIWTQLCKSIFKSHKATKLRFRPRRMKLYARISYPQARRVMFTIHNP